MASTANGASPTTTPVSGLNSAIGAQKDGVVRHAKSNSTRIADRGSKESAAAEQIRRTQQKAWTGGTNPLTQKSTISTHTNGNTVHSKPAVAPKLTTSKEGGMSDKHSHDRLCFVLGGAVGLDVILVTKDAIKFEGILAGSSLSSNSTKITLQMTKKSTPATHQVNGSGVQEAALVGTSPLHAMTFDMKDVVDFTIPQFKLPDTAKHTNGASSGFRTDTNISQGAAKAAERTLVQWVPDGPEQVSLSLDAGGIGQWDQFAAHREKFGENSTYDENLYTTAINRNAPGFAQREANARRVANEISSEVSNIAHVREERGQATEGDNEDEEDKYSGVRRDDPTYAPLSIGGANKYLPPVRRGPTGQPTVSGAPVDAAIISAQLSKPGVAKSIPTKATPPPKDTPATAVTATGQLKGSGPATTPSDGAVIKGESLDSGRQVKAPAESGDTPRTINTEAAAQHQSTPDNPTEDVENQVLDKFRQFANLERQRFADRKRAQVSQDRTAKLNDLLRFSKTFKLKTPIPTDLVGILAKDPVKQEAILNRAQKDHDEAKTGPTTPLSSTASNAKVPSAISNKSNAVPKFDASQVPSPIPPRDAITRNRGGVPQHGGRGDRSSQQPFLSRGAPTFGQKNGPQADRKGPVPAPIPLLDGRAPPTGPAADQLASPQRSAVQTPTSAASMRFNVKATEFRPNVNAPTFNPSSASNAPSSPASVQRTASVSRTASPSSFFGSRKPKPASEQIKILNLFDPIDRMRKDVQKRKAEKKENETVKDYAANGGIPNAYHTAPTWTVKKENEEKKYPEAFHRTGPVSPNQSRSSSAQHIHYPGQMPLGPNSMPPMSTPQHGQPAGLGHHFDERRMPMQGPSPPVYPSPGMSVRQMSNFSSPMLSQAQLAYGQQHYFGSPGQMSMPRHHYAGTPNMMHAQPGQMTAPMMVQQQSSGPYMTVPQQYTQMQMYSPSAGHVYPQPNGYPSPGRVAPMMMHQGSQSSHHGGQPMMYGLSNQGNPMGYPNQQNQIMGMRPTYGAGAGPYGPSHQPPHMQQRTMSSGYNQRNVSQNMAPGQGPPPNAPQQPAAFGQVEAPADDAK